jgi:very-short-patch-repair endonuclease
VDHEGKQPKIVGGAGVSARKRVLARELRQQATMSETQVWQLLRGRRLFGLKFRRQQVVRGYVVDFYCAELKLAIEVDGGVHDDRQAEDQRRQQQLEAIGMRFIRLPNGDATGDRLADLIRPWLPLSIHGEGAGG